MLCPQAEDDLQEARTWLEDAKLYVKTAKEAVTQAEARASSSENKDLNEDIQNEINQANVEVWYCSTFECHHSILMML